MANLYTKTMVNTHRGISKIVDELFSKMVENNESIWKLLTFDEVEIIEHEDDDEYIYNRHEMDIKGENLTYEEKVALLFKNNDDADNYRIQFQPSTDDALKERQCRLHMYIDKVIPINQYVSIISIEFNILCHNKYNMIDGGHRQRIDCICEELINFFNGMILNKGIGNVYFDYPKSRNLDMLCNNLSNSKNVFGTTLTMTMYYGEDKNNSVR